MIDKQNYSKNRLVKVCKLICTTVFIAHFEANECRISSQSAVLIVFETSFATDFMKKQGAVTNWQGALGRRRTCPKSYSFLSHSSSVILTTAGFSSGLFALLEPDVLPITASLAHANRFPLVFSL
jgi:hypothetical protein